MKNISEFVDKHFKIIMIALFLIIVLQQCSHSGKLSKESKNNKVITQKIESLESNSLTKEELEILLEINSLETARKVVYDNNYIVRTATRPDDVMNDYDLKIKELKKKLKK